LADLGHNHLAKLAVSTIHSRLSCYDANWRKHAEIKAIVTRMSCPHAVWLSKCWNVFLNLGPRATLIRHCKGALQWKLPRAPLPFNPALRRL